MSSGSSPLKHKLARAHPHIRIISLTSYLLFILLFNLVVAPYFGWIGKVSAEVNIDTARLVSLANESRVSNDLSSLTIDQRLVNAALAKGKDMFQKQYWSHYGPNGETPWQFINAAGYIYTYAGENLAKDFTSTDAIHTAWMNSPTHRANILNSNYKNIGIAAVSGKQICNGTYPDFSDNNLSTCSETTIVVVMFGTLSNNSSSSNTTTTPTNTTSSSNSTTPSTKSATAPTITSPENGSSLNTSKINISGKSDNGQSVSVYEDDKKIGTVLSNGGVFDIKDVEFPDGNHTIKANAKVGSSADSGYSSDVKFTIDTAKPVFDKTKIKVQLNNRDSNEYYVEGNFAPDTVSVVATVEDKKLQFDKVGDLFSLTFQIPKTDVGIVISAFDKANNEFTNTINLPTNPDLQPAAFLNTDNSTTITPPSLNGRQWGNIVLGLILLGVFALEAFLIIKSGRNNNQSHKGHGLQHFLPLVLVIISVLTLVGGNIN